jgi:hypothetical protein
VKEATLRKYFADGSSLNLNLDTVTFGITLPRVSGLVATLHCLCRVIHTAQNETVAEAVKALFDTLYDRATDDERAIFPEIFDQVRGA